MTTDALFILLLLGTPLSVWVVVATRHLRRALSSRDWAPVPGHILRAKRTTWRPLYGFGSSVARIEYGYTVGQTDYTATDLGGGGDTSLATDSAIAALNPGAEVIVYCDPANPAQAVLEPGATFIDWLNLATPVVALAMVLYLTGALRWAGI
jgi:hypothetical protein